MEGKLQSPFPAPRNLPSCTAKASPWRRAPRGATEQSPLTVRRSTERLDGKSRVCVSEREAPPRNAGAGWKSPPGPGGALRSRHSPSQPSPSPSPVSFCTGKAGVRSPRGRPAPCPAQRPAQPQSASRLPRYTRGAQPGEGREGGRRAGPGRAEVTVRSRRRSRGGAAAGGCGPGTPLAGAR